MSRLGDARGHLRKAREFLTAAEVDLDLGLPNAAASNAVISSINSKDAICIRLTGASAKTDNHSAAVAELRAAGGSGPYGPRTKQLAQVLGRLLQLKSKSQYQAQDVAGTDATRAVEWARKMFDGASDIVNE